MGRPIKLTPQRADLICQRLRAGVPRIYAAESAGIHRDTFHRYMALGKAAQACQLEGCADEHHGPAPEAGGTLTYSDFADMVMVAEADAVVLAQGYVTKAMPRDPRNARWWLERRHPESFKERSEVETTGEPLVINLIPSDRPQEEIDELMREIGPTEAPTPEVRAAGSQKASAKKEEPPEEDEDDEGDWIDPLTGKVIPPPSKEDKGPVRRVVIGSIL